MTQETARQKFLRNHDENIRILRAKAAECEKAGDLVVARAIRGVIEKWEQIGQKAKEEEEGAI